MLRLLHAVVAVSALLLPGFTRALSPPVGLVARVDKIVLANRDGITAPVFASPESYKESLPVREVEGEWLILHQCPFYCKEEHVADVAEHLEFNKRRYLGKREYVRYLVAPSSFGKTCSVLPMFLNSAESNRSRKFTHYFYLACHNNRKRNYKSTGKHYKHAPEVEGAAFIYQAIKDFLQGVKNAIAIGYDDDDAALEDYDTDGVVPYFTDKIQELLMENGFSDKHKILVHIDEHRCMRPDDPAFRKGAMGTLASVPSVTVVATYTDQLRLFNSPTGTFAVCRYPLGVPTLDIRRVMKEIPELQVDRYMPSKPDGTELSMLAGLRFRLAFLIQNMFGHSVLHRNIGEFDVFKDDFNNTVHANLTETGARVFKRPKQALAALSSFCADEIYEFLTGNERPCSSLGDIAAKLLVGISEDEFQDRSDMRVIVTPTNPVYLTLPLWNLLKIDDTSDVAEVYDEGRDLFKKRMEKDPIVVTNVILETAYVWVTACRLALYGKVAFGGESFKMRCKAILEGRLFENRGGVVLAKEVSKEPGVFYYIKDQVFDKKAEKEIRRTHPLCDSFFLTKKKELVLLSITGGGADDVAKRSASLQKWLPDLHADLTTAVGANAVKAVILAPNSSTKAVNIVTFPPNDTTEANKEISIVIVRGKYAVEALGGLSQVYSWFDARP